MANIVKLSYTASEIDRKLGEIDKAANAIIGRYKVSNSILLDDISPFGKVKVDMTHVTNGDTATVNSCGKNLIHTNNFTVPYTDSTVLFEGNITGSFVFSFDDNLTGVNSSSAALFQFIIDGSSQYVTSYGWSQSTGKVFTFSGTLTKVYVHNWNGATGGSLDNIQLEVGTKKTSFESYVKGEEITITSGQIVELNNISPNMTVWSDYLPTDYQVEYNKDLSKVIEKFIDSDDLAQTYGDSSTKAMSQKAVTELSVIDINPLEGKTWGYYSFYYPEDGSVGYQTATWKNRIAIPEIHQYPYDVSISVKDGYKFNVAYLSSPVPSVDTFIEGTSWRTEALSIKAGTYFSLVLANTSNSELTLDESENLLVVCRRLLKDVYNELTTPKSSIITRNKDIEHIVQACSNYGRDGSKYKKCLSMLVSTDIHGDNGVLSNMIEYLNNTHAIDAGICLGDIQTMTYGDNDGTWYTDIVNTSEKNFYTVLGNHDIGVWNGYEGNGTAELAFEKFIAPTLGKIGKSNLTTPYYAVTYDNHNTVVIVLNNYDAPDVTDESGEFVISRDNELFSQEQIDWFIQTLNAVPTGYHVVIAMHSVGFAHTIVESNFTHHNDDYSLEMRYPYGWCTVIPDIVNAWKNGTTLTESYEPTEYTDILSTLTVACDFTVRGEGEFVCYLVGHDHTDKIMKCQKYEDQLIVSLVTSASSDYHVEHSDLPRIKGTKTEDALTIFSVDTSHRLIKLVRVGSNITNELVDRTFTALSY